MYIYFYPHLPNINNFDQSKILINNYYDYINRTFKFDNRSIHFNVKNNKVKFTNLV